MAPTQAQAPTQTLAPTLPLEAATATLGWYEIYVPLAKIDEAPGHNPRKDYGEADGTFAALVQSIRERGMLEMPRLMPVTDLAGDWDPVECRFTIVSGHRRIAAAKALGWESVRVCVPDAEGEALASYTDTDKLIDALAENLLRKDLNCIEVAEGIGRLEAFGRTQEQIARLIGRSQGRVSRCVRLLELPYGVRALLREGALYQSVAEEMLPLVGSGLLPGEIDAIAYKGIESKLTAEGMATLVRHKVAELTRQQAALFAPNNSEGEDSEGEDEVDARIAKTLASTKGMDKEPAPKETNGLTRSESDSQFASAMAPDPDVIPLKDLPSPSSLPQPPIKCSASAGWANWLENHGLDAWQAVAMLSHIVGPGGLEEAKRPGLWVRLAPTAAEQLLDLCAWQREGGQAPDLLADDPSPLSRRAGEIIEAMHQVFAKEREGAHV